MIRIGRLVKCQYCEDKVDKDIAFVYKKKNYHENCFKQWEQEKTDYQSLLEYVCKIHRINRPTGLMLKQIKNYKEEQQYKYKGMELALRYFYDILDNKVREGDGIGIIPFVYEDAKQNYIKQMKIAESLNQFDQENKQIIVHINPSVNKRRNKQIDISAI